ncbi:hypothetical protein K443DRAFT_436965 [Laccaria amethystina LaAM-08-1]|uniref:Uncharacterized protein n=1 Tax=Laccaria amethystina LaAM-08-1 TaxID=1095629 RepID=A0A0C9XGP2_9AGAR|nr:hypothetical protein K443DRAFT_436965 [Laccaria amethystina LaAM-08-1]
MTIGPYTPLSDHNHKHPLFINEDRRPQAQTLKGHPWNPTTFPNQRQLRRLSQIRHRCHLQTRERGFRQWDGRHDLRERRSCWALGLSLRGLVLLAESRLFLQCSEEVQRDDDGLETTGSLWMHRIYQVKRCSFGGVHRSTFRLLLQGTFIVVTIAATHKTRKAYRVVLKHCSIPRSIHMLSMLDLRWPEGPIGNWIKGIGVAFKSYGCLGAKVFFSWPLPPSPMLSYEPKFDHPSCTVYLKLTKIVDTLCCGDPVYWNDYLTSAHEEPSDSLRLLTPNILSLPVSRADGSLSSPHYVGHPRRQLP